MPFRGDTVRGTGSNRKPSDDYCIDCYQEGWFTTPTVTLKEMIAKISDKMRKEGFPNSMIESSKLKMADLKRWKSKQFS